MYEWMWEYASWELNLKKAEYRINAFEMCWRRLESPLDCKEIKPANPRGNQSWIFIGRTDTEAETLILWLSDVKSWLMEKTLMLVKIEGRRRREWQRTRLDGINSSMDMSLRKLQEIVKDREAWHAAVHRVTKNQTRLSDWTTTAAFSKNGKISLLGKSLVPLGRECPFELETMN